MTTDIIINSGIQFTSIPVNLTDEVVNKVKLRFSEEIVEKKDEAFGQVSYKHEFADHD